MAKSPHLRSDWPTSAPGLAYICAATRSHLRRDSPHLRRDSQHLRQDQPTICAHPLCRRRQRIERGGGALVQAGLARRVAAAAAHSANRRRVLDLHRGRARVTTVLREYCECTVY